MKKFTKSSLKSGHIVVTRNENIYVYFDAPNAMNTDSLFLGLSRHSNYLKSESLNENLTNAQDNDYDIIEVYEYNPHYGLSASYCLNILYEGDSNIQDIGGLNLVYKRQQLKELTVAEISELLGYEVKIVKEHENG